MGQAKRRRENQEPTVYHHTSTLRTNMIWMDGVIQVEGTVASVPHPDLKEIKADMSLRRDIKDFPALAWFTTKIEIPKCLVVQKLYTEDPKSGERKAIHIGAQGGNRIALNRIALGFPIAKIDVVPWPEYYGYGTAEGNSLNESARDAGDNPDDWYVSENPIDVLSASELWVSASVVDPWLTRSPEYLKKTKELVEVVRKNKGYVPPTWLPPEKAKLLAAQLGLPIIGA